MKKLIIFSLILLMATGAFAQRGFYHGGGYYRGGGYYARPRVSIGIGVPLYPYSSYPIYGYSPFFGYPPMGYGFGYGYGMGYGYPYGYGSRYNATPSKLDLQIHDIYSDYNHRIWEVKHDKTIKRKERRKMVHELEYQRDQAIIQAKKDYYNKPSRRHNFNNNNNSNNNNNYDNN